MAGTRDYNRNETVAIKTELNRIAADRKIRSDRDLADLLRDYVDEDDKTGKKVLTSETVRRARLEDQPSVGHKVVRAVERFTGRTLAQIVDTSGSEAASREIDRAALEPAAVAVAADKALAAGWSEKEVKAARTELGYRRGQVTEEMFFALLEKNKDQIDKLRKRREELERGRQPGRVDALRRR